MSNNKNSNSSKPMSSKGNKYAILSEEALSKVSYYELWEEAMDMGLIGANRESRKEYYHMVYRKSLIQFMKEYRQASDKAEKKALADKFETNLAKECRKKDLWEEGLDNGMIFEELPSEGLHYTSYKLEDLEKHCAKYKALKDEEKKEDYAYTFAKTLRVEGEAPARKNTERKKNSEVPVQRPPLPQKEGPSFAMVVSKNTQPVQESSTQKTRNAERVNPLAACWQEGMKLGFIHPKNNYHCALPSFITPSELESLLKEWKSLPKTEQGELAFFFKEELDNYNKGITITDQGFKVHKSYRQIWNEAARLEIITDDFDYDYNYSEWLSAENLTAYIQTIRSLGEEASKGFIAKITGQLNQASAIISLRKTYSEMKKEDLINLSNKNKPSTREPAYATCSSCSAKLNQSDLSHAMASWVTLKDNREEARGRYLRWHAYRKFLHSQCPKA